MVFRLIKDTYSSRYSLIMMKLKKRLRHSETLFFPSSKIHIPLFKLDTSYIQFMNTNVVLHYGSQPPWRWGKGAERTLRIVKHQ